MYGRTDVGHCVVYGEAGGHGAAGGIDVEGYWLFGGVGFEKEELGDDGGGGGRVDFAIEADYALFEEPGVDVVSGPAAAGEGFGYEGGRGPGAGGLRLRVWLWLLGLGGGGLELESWGIFREGGY